MYRLGIDLGGTNIVAGVVNEEYKSVKIGLTITKHIQTHFIGGYLVN